MRRSIVRAGVVAVVAVIALGACGSTSNKASKVSTVQLVAGAADTAAAQKSARISGHETMTIEGEAKTLPIEGAIDFTYGSAEMTIDAGALGLKGLGSIKAVVVDHAMYMNFATLLSGSDVPESLRGKKWLKLDLNELGANAGGSSSSAAGLLESLRGAGDVKLIGSERIDGVDTDHFHATIDVAKALEKVKPGPLRDMAQKGMAEMGASYPVDVWIDHDGLPRRYALKISTKQFAVSETVDYTDFGTTIHVEKPPADETASFSALLAAAKDTSTN